MPKNDIVRRRGDYPGEAGADWGYGATARPEADEHYIRRRKEEGLRGQDKQQSLLRDRSSDQRDPGRGEPPPRKRDGVPEGLERPRKGPYDKNVGRNEMATQVPGDGVTDDELGFPPDDESKWG
jgi:hypothetical protein